MALKLLAVPVALAAALAASGSAAESIGVFNWSDYFGATTLEDFEAETGIAVNYDRYDSLEAMETRMLAGGTGYDWVMTPADQGARLIAAGALAPLDKAALPNLVNLDPRLTELLRRFDPDLSHLVPYAWGTSGLAYDRAALLARMPDAPLDSYALLFDPAVAARFADCGIAVIDAPTEVIGVALNYLGLDPQSVAEADLTRAGALLDGIRPFVTHFNTGVIVDDLATGQICLALAWNADAASASSRAAESGLERVIDYVVPKEGTVVWFDAMAVPSDAPNPGGAHRFIDFLLRDPVAAALTVATRYASGNAGARALLPPDLRDDPAIHPPEAVMGKLFLPPVVTDPAAERRRTDLWSAFRTGR